MFENPRRGRWARNFTTNVPKILGVKSSSEQIFSENCRWVPLIFMLTLPTSREGPVGKPMLPRKRRTPDRLEVGAGAPSHLQTAKDHFQEGSILRLFILSSGLSTSALIRKASAPTPRWKPSSVVKAANGDDYEAEFSFLKHHTAQMLIQGLCWGN